MANCLLKEIAGHHFAIMFPALDFAQDDWWLLQIAHSTLFVVSRGYTSLLVPGDDPPQGITIFMDIALNPGPSASESLTGATTSCKSTWDTVPYFGINGLSMILCLWSPLHPLSKLLVIQDRAKNLEEQLWMGGGREVSVTSHRPVSSCDLK